jgi:hypothetical protein
MGVPAGAGARGGGAEGTGGAGTSTCPGVRVAGVLLVGAGAGGASRIGNMGRACISTAFPVKMGISTELRLPSSPRAAGDGTPLMTSVNSPPGSPR